MKANFTFQVQSTMVTGTPDEIGRWAQWCADAKNETLKALVYIGNKWHLWKTFYPKSKVV